MSKALFKTYKIQIKVKNIIFIYIFFFSSLCLNVVAQECEHITRNGGDKPNGYYLGKQSSNPIGYISFIEFGLPDTSKISANIYDVYGTVLFSSAYCRLSGGNYSFNWGFLFDDPSTKSGIYFFKLKLDFDRLFNLTEMHFEGTRKFIIVK